MIQTRSGISAEQADRDVDVWTQDKLSDDAPLCISIRRSLPSYQLIIEVTA